jgi:hypothetical protein
VLAGQDSRRFNAGFTLYGTVMGIKARLLLERGHYLLCKAVLVDVFRRSIILAIPRLRLPIHRDDGCTASGGCESFTFSLGLRDRITLTIVLKL